MTQTLRGSANVENSLNIQGSPVESSQFVGMPIFGPYREPMGSVANIVIDCAGGRILCIVATFESLHLKEGFYPIPWMAFKFNSKIGGYQTHLVKRQLLDAPRYSSNHNWKTRFPEVAKSIGDYYGRCY